MATALTLFMVFTLLFGLYKIHWLRDRFGNDTCFMLRLIAAPSGRASLSQLQVLVWLVVVGAGAIYVMTLTGELISITSGTLIMLGISGGAVLTAGLKDKSVGNSKDDTPPPVNPPPVAPSLPVLRPCWADIVTDPRGPEVDVTRVQMLFFTVITALFVAIKIVTSYTIPEIPDSFQLLMGISNGVYVSRKFI